MARIKYEIDPYYRLVALASGRTVKGAGFRKVIDGRFRISKGNALVYHAKSPVRGDLPHQVRFKGSWKITDAHDLCLIVDRKQRTYAGDTILLRGDILDVRGNALLFAVTTKRSDTKKNTYVLRLNGSWQVDRANRLVFNARRADGKTDHLVLRGAWSFGPDKKIIYEYIKNDLIRKCTVRQKVRFEGWWQHCSGNRISYKLAASNKKPLEITGSYGMVRGDLIKYEIGICAETGGTPILRILNLFGAWKLDRYKKLWFEVKCRDGRVRAIGMGARITVYGKGRVKAVLKSGSGWRQPGISLVFSGRTKNNGEIFLRLLKAGNEKAVHVGSAGQW